MTAVTAKWLIPTVVYIFAAGALGVLSKVALRYIRWTDLVMWSGLAYVLVGLFLLAIGKTQVEFVTGSWLGRVRHGRDHHVAVHVLRGAVHG